MRALVFDISIKTAKDPGCYNHMKIYFFKNVHGLK